MDGWSIIVNLDQPVILTMHEATGATTLTVKGDCTVLAASGDYWLLDPPPGVNPQTGTLASIDDEGNTTWHAATPRDTSTAAARPNAPGRFLWAHYRYLPPMAGFTDDEGATVGEMGTNKLGNYHCRNRVYDILQGRWTSPDPASSPWSILFSYAGSYPQGRSDPTGLVSGWSSGDATGSISSDSGGSGGYSSKWKYEIDVGKYAEGYRIFQLVALYRTWTFCDGAVVSLQQAYLQTFDSRTAVDEQRTGDPARTGRDAREALAGAGYVLEGTERSDCSHTVKEYVESRINIVFLAKPTDRATAQMADGSNVFIEVANWGMLPDAVGRHSIRASKGTEAEAGFKYLGNALTDIAVQGSGLRGSGSGYGIMYRATWECCSGRMLTERLRTDWNKFPDNNRVRHWSR